MAKVTKLFVEGFTIRTTNLIWRGSGFTFKMLFGLELIWLKTFEDELPQVMGFLFLEISYKLNYFNSHIRQIDQGRAIQLILDQNSGKP